MSDTNDSVSKQVKIRIVEQNLSQVNGSIYDSVIKQRVFKKVKDDNSAKALVEQLNKLEKMKDEYEKILKELDETDNKK